MKRETVIKKIIARYYNRDQDIIIGRIISRPKLSYFRKRNNRLRQIERAAKQMCKGGIKA